MTDVDSQMQSMAEQRELANEIGEAISNPIYGGMELDDVSAPSLWHSYSLTDAVITLGRLEGRARRTGTRPAEREVDGRRPCPRTYPTWRGQDHTA